MRHPALMIGTLLLSACAVGPDYRAPEPAAHDAWHEAATAGGPQSAESDTLAAWWTTLGDRC
jgi:outer membrane protein TolC